MIKNIFRLTMALAVLVMFSCNDDDASDPASYAIFGDREVSPLTTGTYTLHVSGVDATWTSSDTDVMTITSTDASTAVVSFLKSGTVRLTATDGVRVGVVDITVDDGGTDVTVTYAGTGSLKSGASDTVFFTFPAALTEVPSLIMNEDTSGFTSGGVAAFVSSGSSLTSLSSYNGSDEVFYAIYTAGSGDGQPEGLIESITLTDTYGGVTAENIYVELPVVDNTVPYAQIAFSQEVANDSTSVTITVTFSENVIPDYSYSPDSLIYINLSGGGVLDSTYSLTATSDAKVWTLSYMTNGGGDGTLTASVDESSVTDYAGNEAYVPSATMEIDNTAPDPATAGEFSVEVTGSVVEVTLSGDDTVQWLYQTSGTDAPEVSDFDDASSEDDIFSLDEGTYDFYYIATDEAGNVSAVESVTGVVVPNS